MRAFNFWYSILSAALGALLLLLFDNMLYAAIVQRLRTSFGIEEADMTAWIAANLILILVAIIVLFGLYRLSLHYHMAKVIDLGGLPTATESSSAPTTSPARGRIRSLLHRFEPLPAIALGLVVAVIGVVYYQNWINRRPTSTTPPRITEIDRLAGLNALTQLASNMQSAATYSKAMREIADNWQYKISTDGPDAFSAALNQAGAGYIYGLNGMYYVTTQFKGIPSDILALAKDDGTLAACNTRAKALAEEIQRIKEHKADLVFTLVNDIKLIEWRDGIKTCDEWIAGRRDVIEKKRAEYSQKGN